MQLVNNHFVLHARTAFRDAQGAVNQANQDTQGQQGKTGQQFNDGGERSQERGEGSVEANAWSEYHPGQGQGRHLLRLWLSSEQAAGEGAWEGAMEWLAKAQAVAGTLQSLAIAKAHAYLSPSPSPTATDAAITT